MAHELGQSPAVNKTASRIENQTEMVKTLVRKIQRITDTNIQHAHQLGFYSPPSETKPSSGAPTPVTTSLDDAIRDLDQAVDHLDGSMNLFN